MPFFQQIVLTIPETAVSPFDIIENRPIAAISRNVRQFKLPSEASIVFQFLAAELSMFHNLDQSFRNFPRSFWFYLDFAYCHF